MDIFTTGVLVKVVQSLPAPAPFILNSFFREEQTETSEEIHFDVDTSKPRLAPFVSPVLPGQIVESSGYQTNTFKPAYVKDKRVFNPDRPLKRAIGEQIGGGFSPQQRIQLALASDLADQLEMLARRQELMAIEALRTGAITVVGAGYPSVSVNFGRHNDLTKALTLAARWGESGVSPLDNVEAWALEVTKQSGATPSQLIMDVKAWQLFHADPKVQKLLDRFRGADRLNPTVAGQGARYMGNIGDFDVWVYSGWYSHPDTGALTPYLPDNTVIMTSPELEGARAYGAIRDEEAGYQALPYFAKSWVEKDPAARILLMQSAPLPVPYRVNASLCATVR